jgi:hypothetical protein
MSVHRASMIVLASALLAAPAFASDGGGGGESNGGFSLLAPAQANPRAAPMSRATQSVGVAGASRQTAGRAISPIRERPRQMPRIGYSD